MRTWTTRVSLSALWIPDDCFSGRILQELNWYVAIDKGWENTSFLDGAIVQQPALFLIGDRDPSTRPVFGIDRQEPAIKSLRTNFRDLREIITMPGVGHTPPEERPEEINAIVLKFLKELIF
jgi:pimeloyl-ACP methyl ester carboxylesterase